MKNSSYYIIILFSFISLVLFGQFIRSAYAIGDNWGGGYCSACGPVHTDRSNGGDGWYDTTDGGTSGPDRLTETALMLGWHPGVVDSVISVMQDVALSSDIPSAITALFDKLENKYGHIDPDHFGVLAKFEEAAYQTSDLGLQHVALIGFGMAFGRLFGNPDVVFNDPDKAVHTENMVRLAPLSTVIAREIIDATTIVMQEPIPPTQRYWDLRNEDFAQNLRWQDAGPVTLGGVTYSTFVDGYLNVNTCGPCIQVEIDGTVHSVVMSPSGPAILAWVDDPQMQEAFATLAYEKSRIRDKILSFKSLIPFALAQNADNVVAERERLKAKAKARFYEALSHNLVVAIEIQPGQNTPTWKLNGQRATGARINENDLFQLEVYNSSNNAFRCVEIFINNVPQEPGKCTSNSQGVTGPGWAQLNSTNLMDENQWGWEPILKVWRSPSIVPRQNFNINSPSYNVVFYHFNGNSGKVSVPFNLQVDVSQPVTPTLPPVRPSLSLSSSARYLAPGQTATITWATARATSCTASGDWSGSLGTEGERVVTAPLATGSGAVYRIQCQGPGGTASETVRIFVGEEFRNRIYSGDGGTSDGNPGGGTSACSTIGINDSPPTGFAPPYTYFTQLEKIQFMKTNCWNSNSVSIQLDNARERYYYRYGYFVNGNNEWEQITYSGEIVWDDWIKGNATGSFQSSDPNVLAGGWVLTYACDWKEGTQTWKCGCQDFSCTVPAWNIQGYLR